MDTIKFKTLEQVHDAIDSVEEARAMRGLTVYENYQLEIASVQLRNLERAIIRNKTNELVEDLTSRAQELKELADQINRSAEKLASVSLAIEKAAKVVEAFINIVGTAVAAGLL